MRSQEENGEQPGGHQPDHALESAQASQDELGPRSVAQGLATQPVLVGVCWCWRGRGNEVAWEGGVAGERSGENSCFWASGAPSPAPARLRMGVAWKVLLRNGVTRGGGWVVVRTDLGTTGLIFPSRLPSLVLSLASVQEAGGRKGRKPVASAY